MNIQTCRAESDFRPVGLFILIFLKIFLKEPKKHTKSNLLSHINYENAGTVGIDRKKIAGLLDPQRNMQKGGGDHERIYRTHS